MAPKGATDHGPADRQRDRRYALGRAPRLLWLIVALVALPSVAGAQAIRGAVVERADSTPIPGVIVILVDDAGTVAARALTSEDGRYRLSASPGAYRLRTLRIGYRPVESAPIALRAGDDRDEMIALSSVPLALDTLRVQARGRCRAGSTPARDVAVVWEQARTALTAAQMTAGSGLLRVTIEKSYRAIDPSTNRVLSDMSYLDSGYVTRPWRSISIDSLRRHGYVYSAPDGWITYNAPDLDLLISNEFVVDHCFGLATGADPKLLGVEFEPARDRAAVTGIRGTVWLDRQSSELRRMVFSYTNTGTRGVAEAGGEMEFVRFANGAWAISRWNIRMPLLEARRGTPTGVPGGITPNELRLREWRISGGALASVTRRGDTLWARPWSAGSAVAAVSPAKDLAPLSPGPRAQRPDTVVRLDSVIVRAARPMPTEFEERRLSRQGQYLTRADLDKHRARALPEILAQVPGVRIARDAGKAWVTSGRGAMTRINERRQISPRFSRDPVAACYADVYVDGLLVYGGKKDETFFDVSEIAPTVLEGIEYYASPAQTPVKYARPGAACGTLLLWTRRR